MPSVVALRVFRGVRLRLELHGPLLILAGRGLAHLRQICYRQREDLLAATGALYLWSQGNEEAASSIFILAWNYYLASTIGQDLTSDLRLSLVHWSRYLHHCFSRAVKHEGILQFRVLRTCGRVERRRSHQYLMPGAALLRRLLLEHLQGRTGDLLDVPGRVGS